MFRKLGEAIQLLACSFPLVAMLVLTVWLPGNFLINYIAFFAVDEESAFRVMQVAALIEGVFGPIYLGAMIYALWNIKSGRPVGYWEAIGVGFRNWGRLFAARFVAGLLIGIGLLAFIVPGVVLAIRYALLDCAVIIEGADTARSRQRSTQLTEGIRLEILAMAVFFYFGFLLVSVMIYLPLSVAAEIGQLGAPVAMTCEVAADCVLDLVFAVLQIALFLYYWDKRRLELGAGETTSQEAASSGVRGSADVAIELGPLEDDGNPYRSPQA